MLAISGVDRPIAKAAFELLVAHFAARSSPDNNSNSNSNSNSNNGTSNNADNEASDSASSSDRADENEDEYDADELAGIFELLFEFELLEFAFDGFFLCIII